MKNSSNPSNPSKSYRSLLLEEGSRLPETARRDPNKFIQLCFTDPYGRRIQTFPVWAHRHGMTFPRVVFQNGDEDNLSHPFTHSSPESPPPYCRPIRPQETEFDAGTCASDAFTDKGTLSYDEPTRYPPRSDLQRIVGTDDESVDLFRALNPFDALAQQRFGKPYAEVGTEAERLTLLYAIEHGAFFQKLKGHLVVAFYDNKAVWPLFGYEGSSYEKGGYLDRGFDDIDWLPADA